MNRRRFAATLSLLLAPLGAAAAAPLDPAGCTPTALATKDNDIRLEGDWRGPGNPIDLPAAVATQIQAAAARVIARVGAEIADGLACDDLLPPVYRVTGFGRFQLFVAEIRVATAGRFFYLVLHDPVTGAVTRDPPWLGAKLVAASGTDDPLIKTPLVSSADLFRNQRRQIVFEERVHNGTVYNGVVYHYFDVGPQLELIRVLARETRVVDPTRGDRIYQRELAVLKKSRLRLDLYAASPDGKIRREALGYTILESAGPGHAFRVVERHARDKSGARTLVTYSEGADDDAFLREGYRVYY